MVCTSSIGPGGQKTEYCQKVLGYRSPHSWRNEVCIFRPESSNFESVLRSEDEPKERSYTIESLNCILRMGLMNLNLSDIYKAKYDLHGGHRNRFCGVGLVESIRKRALTRCDCCSYQVSLKAVEASFSPGPSGLGIYATSTMPPERPPECVHWIRLALRHE